MAASVQIQASDAQPLKGNSSPQSRSNTEVRKPRPKRPNYNEVHSKPLPLEVYPLPVFIPHNPISIVRIAITLLSHSLWPPRSHSVVHKAYFSPETQSIHVTDPKSIRALWEQGFWGSGSLSRSEPRWLDQEKRKRGIEAATTSEEVTRARREERRQFKLERAKAQREAIEQQMREEGKLDAETDLEELVENGSVTESPRGTLYPADAGVPLGDVAAVENPSIIEEVNRVIAEEMPSFGAEIGDQEHLQLTFEEAFFLNYVLGVLDICQDADPPNNSSYLLHLFCTYSEFPLPSHAEAHLQSLYSWRVGALSCPELLDRSAGSPIPPDNPFLLKYVVFHHFRSLGWVVRPGIKFACDYLLYLRGPAFHHAEFAIMIVPSYSHPYWSESPERVAECKKKEKKDWWWFHRLNRVQSQVHKTLMLVYVEIPPPWDEGREKPVSKLDVGKILKSYSVREFVFRRWSPNRNRD
ncbi:hypothetical protein BU26DRAFT_61809 [Trematosphaeria pertusa]|uniref:tRNA-splicing endonuclease subunit Sen2 n=1 Tax=Trematosphaeria pertusa TaxID=390896 RepID=A0A6A6I6C6_9PLEO|nr:uncharacterized protein BU26DRAFT_61809 [Trematosphaeria pertusa]KAF2246104.1 hypothetical protein BU26DRAFT_61809 [Trematosphaeria pertusa]